MIKNQPIAVEVKKGKVYFWCSCGKSKSPPFCDGSHKDTAYLPVRYEADTSKQVLFCGCGKTANQPLCDRSTSQDCYHVGNSEQ